MGETKMIEQSREKAEASGAIKQPFWRRPEVGKEVGSVEKIAEFGRGERLLNEQGK
jgi:hypothetical protein